jgi:hypothetical protein
VQESEERDASDKYQEMLEKEQAEQQAADAEYRQAQEEQHQDPNDMPGEDESEHKEPDEDGYNPDEDPDRYGDESQQGEANVDYNAESDYDDMESQPEDDGQGE